MVNRQNIIEDVLNLYKDPQIIHCKLMVTFEGERGLDFGGVTEDLFSSFWEAAFKKYFDGDVVKIPLVSPTNIIQLGEDTLPAFGRILVHGWRLTNNIPVQFCEASFMAMLHGGEIVPEEVLKRSFLWYITQFERDVLCCILEGNKIPDYKEEAIYGLYQRFSMACLPAKTEEELHRHIITMAKSEFIFKPMFVLSSMIKGIEDKTRGELQKELTPNKISQLYDELTPTTDKVLRKLFREQQDLTVAQQRVFTFLTIYVGDLDKTRLRRFLHFVTGSTSTPRKPGIKVSFNGAQRLCCLPSASTCSSALILPTTYESYGSFKRDFDIILTSDEAFELSKL